ncbi:unnamed protein product [Mytilus coruscus]|uniref:Novel STAND NTPase 3 domain-containing protein n=1 Tax=Mytilus coruscus TaxID=42192 RepID=A0A6J8ER71_MYTCO|nr:unnamed protein product [Mytilus coruscus]
MEEIMFNLEKVEEELAQYKKDSHSEKSQAVPDDLMKKDEEELRIRDIHNQHINDWIKEDDKFIVTIATNKILENLKTDSCVLVVGCAGNGKSSIIRHIALKLRNEDQYEIIPIVLSPGSIFELINRKRKQIFIVDDFCGKVITNALSVEVWFSQIHEILKLILNSGTNDSEGFADVKFLLATGINIYNDSIFKKLQMLMKYVFILSKWPLTEDEKLRIIKKYISPEEEIILSQTLKSDKAYFPLLCKIAENKKADQIIKLFSNLGDFIKQDLVDLKNSNNLKFCTITLCALLNNNFKTEILDEVYESDTEMLAFENVCLECNLGPHKDKVKKKIKEQLENLEDMYVAKTDNYYHFIHGEIYQIAVSVCGQIFLHTFIQFVRSSFIAERFSFQTNMTVNNKHIIIIDNKIAEKKYFDRLMLDLEKGETYSTFHNSQLRSESYRTKFIAYCRMRQQKVCELFKLFNVKSDTVSITCAERDYADYIEFTKQHHFYSHKMRKPLIESTWEGNEDIVQLLLKCDCDINETDRFGRTALFVACLLGKKKIVNVLLDNNANMSLCNEKGQSPLFVASRERYDDIVNTLLHNNADVNQCDVNGDSPFLVACSGSQLSTVKILSRRMPQILQRNNLGQTPLFVASMNGRKFVIRYLLSVLSEYISTPDNEGRSPLFIACMKGHQNVVELLLKRNANVSQSDWNKRSPLFITAAEGYADIVTILIKNKADINQCDEESMTPLSIACDKGRTEIVRILVNSHADINITDLKKRTPLYVACSRGFKDIVKLLHENNASILECNKWGGSPLFAACREGHFDIVKYLVEHGANVFSQDSNGTTPLLVAIENGNTEIGKFLIDSGFDINRSDNYKRTPLHVAAVGGHNDIVNVLLNAGAITNLTDVENQTPLDLARKYSSTDIVNLLSSDN